MHMNAMHEYLHAERNHKCHSLARKVGPVVSFTRYNMSFFTWSPIEARDTRMHFLGSYYDFHNRYKYHTTYPNPASKLELEVSFAQYNIASVWSLTGARDTHMYCLGLHQDLS